MKLKTVLSVMLVVFFVGAAAFLVIRSRKN